METVVVAWYMMLRGGVKEASLEEENDACRHVITPVLK